MTTCPCGLQEYSNCCAIYHRGDRVAPTPEALMRSRYSAYALADMDYVKKTMLGQALESFDESSAKVWALSVKWLGLQILRVKTQSNDCGFVEFIARFIEGDKERSIRELSEFQKVGERWYYIDGTYQKPQENSRPSKVGRNSPCPCNSQKKYKNCHGK